MLKSVKERLTKLSIIRGGTPPSHLMLDMGFVNLDITPKANNSLYFAPKIKATATEDIKVSQKRKRGY
jgi:hypothetical protein